MAAAAAGPPFRALAQCSTRIRSPSNGCQDAARSPAAYTSGSELRSVSSTRTPSPTSSPASAASSVGAGADPDHHDVRRHRAAVAEHHRRDLAGGAALPGHDPDLAAQPQVDAVLGVQVGEDLPELVTEHPAQRQVRPRSG